MNHAERTGRPWTERRPVELRSEAEGGAGSMSNFVRVETVAQVAEAARAADPLTRIQHALARLHIPTQETPPDYARRFIQSQVVDGYVREMCTLCSREATDGHLASANHLRRLEDQALGDLLAGPAQSTRNITQGRVNRGMYGLPSQAAALGFWGDSLPNLVTSGLDILRHSDGLLVDRGLSGHHGRHRVPPGLIRTAELGLLKYGGNGKYFRNDFWYWQDLPSDLAILDQPADDVPALPAVAEARRAPSTARGHPRPHTSMGNMNDDEGWWPVLVLSLGPDLDWLTPESPGWRVILVICFYQLLGSEHFAWWLEIPVWP